MEVITKLPLDFLAFRINKYVDVLPKSRGIVVSDGLGVSKGLEDRVAVENLVFDRLLLTFFIFSIKEFCYCLLLGMTVL